VTPCVPALCAAIVASAVLSVYGQAIRDAQVKPTDGSATISGTVFTRSDPPAPIAGVRVTARGQEAGTGGTTFTDHTGAFVIPHLPAGRYSVNFERAGYVTQLLGTTRVGQLGALIGVMDGEVAKGLTAHLEAGGRVEGHVTDRAGNPIGNASVVVLRKQLGNSGATLVRVGNAASSRSDGAFVIADLPQGEYLLAATPLLATGPAAGVRTMTMAELEWARSALRQLTQVTGTVPASVPPPSPLRRVYQTTYFPSVTDPSRASTVSVSSGQSTSGVAVIAEPISLVQLTGTISGLGPSIAGVEVALVHHVQPLSGASPTIRGVVNQRSGTFSVVGVPGGRYRLIGKATSRAPEGARTLWDIRDIELGEHATQFEGLSLSEGTTVSGHVDGAGSPRILLRPFGVGARSVALTSTGVAIVAGGKFEFKDVPPGQYTLVVEGAEIVGATRSNTSVIDTPLTVVPGESINDIEISTSQAAMGVLGRVVDVTGADVTGVMVVLFPQDRGLWAPPFSRVRAVRTDSKGTFQVRLPPGSYRLAAVSDLVEGEWFDPAFLADLIPASLPVVVEPGKVVPVTLQKTSPRY